LETSLSIVLVVVGFFAIAAVTLYLTAQGRHDLAQKCPYAWLFMDPPYRSDTHR
jgi:hypothetical protein